MISVLVQTWSVFAETVTIIADVFGFICIFINFVHKGSIYVMF